MNIFESFRVSVRGLTNNKMRSALTMLGIIIGVGVVIIVVAIGEGASARVAELVNSLGTNLLTVFPGGGRIRINAATTTKGADRGANNKMTLLDAETIGKNFPKTVDSVAPQVRDQIQIGMGNMNASTSLVGATINFPYVRGVEVSKGQFFSQSDIDGSQKVCVVGTTVAEKLSGSAKNDLGMTTRG